MVLLAFGRYATTNLCCTYGGVDEAAHRSCLEGGSYEAPLRVFMLFQVLPVFHHLEELKRRRPDVFDQGDIQRREGGTMNTILVVWPKNGVRQNQRDDSLG
eukprot:TRINITY_DN7487_c0_g1_i4.p2 TRINITY_DN7487_c0_g1~~TRINITY_DN7487_c0_g1_i4.p2  ORF type:complete len:101 (-),score=8.29 TRINITY_DN7487_c0_g1_i4:778-1080(-)